MKFKAGKAYKHTTGKMMYVCGKIKSKMWGKCLVAECNKSNVPTTLEPVGKNKNDAVNWSEIDLETYVKECYTKF